MLIWFWCKHMTLEERNIKVRGETSPSLNWVKNSLACSTVGCVFYSLSPTSQWFSVSEKLSVCHRAQRTESPCYVKGLCSSVTSSRLSLSSCKQCTTTNWWALCHPATALLVLWVALLAQCQMSMTPIRLKWKESTLHSSPCKKSYKNKMLVKRRQLFQQEMFKRWNIMWKFRWVKKKERSWFTHAAAWQ